MAAVLLAATNALVDVPGPDFVRVTAADEWQLGEPFHGLVAPRLPEINSTKRSVHACKRPSQT